MYVLYIGLLFNLNSIYSVCVVLSQSLKTFFEQCEHKKMKF